MKVLYFIGIAAVLAVPQVAAAQGVPTLVGTWKGTAYAVSVGSNPYRTPETKEPSFPPSHG